MSAVPEKLAALRHLLAERFPTIPPTAGGGALGLNRVLPTGVPVLDESTGGGIPLSAVTELVCAAPSCGSHLLLGQLFAVTRATRTRVAMIDSADSFDPASFEEDLLAHLVWVRCDTTSAGLHSADLLTRDANLGLVVLDLRRAPVADLLRTPASQWYRLQRAVEPTDLALIIFTSRASVPSARLRLMLGTSHPISALQDDRHLLVTTLAPALQRQRQQAAAG